MRTSKNTLFLTAVIFLAIAGFAAAGQITLDNPLGNVNDFPTLIANIITYVRTIVGALAILMFLWSGILFISAGMFSGNYDWAKKTLWYAAIGAAIALAAEGLAQVVRQVVGAP